MLDKVPLRDLFQVRSSKRVLKSQWQSSGVPFYRGREITLLSKQGYVDNELFITEESYNEFADKYGVPQPEDIVITAIGTIGNSYIVQENDRFYFKDASVLWLKKMSEVDSSYINLWLKSSQMREQLDEGNGATVDTLTIKKLQSLVVDLPPLDEQKRIVATLDQVFADIEQARATAETNLRNARELFDSYLQQVFSQRGEGWKNKKWSEILEIKNGKNQRAVESSTGRYPIIGSAGKVMAYADDYICNEGTTIIGRKGTINNPIFIDTKFWNVDTAFGLQALDGLDKKFLYYFCLSYDFTKRDKGSGRPSLVKSDLLKVVMPVPEIDEQRRLVSEIERLNSLLAKVFSIYEKKLDCLDELKKSILHKAFTGELTKSKGIAA